MSLFVELKRRNVIRVGVAYAIVAWVIAQIAEFAFQNFGAPEWVLKTIVVVLLLGLPIALIFAWAFEMTPEGIKREAEVDRSQSIVSQTGHKLDRMIIGVLVVALAWFAWDKFYIASDSETIAESATTESVAETLLDKSVAVLPFIAMSSGPDDEYFADGLTEEILNSLAQLPELLVTARTSAFSFKGQDIPVQEIAAALGVQHIVEGSVRRSGERLRVTAQLIRADDGFHLWSENYDSRSTDTISVQENIAEKIAAALDVVLDEKQRASMRKAGLRDVEAFTLYQKGLEIYDLSHGEIDQRKGLLEANAIFEQVMALVPEFSQVYLDHSDLYIHQLTDSAGLSSKLLVDKEADAAAFAAALADYDAAIRYAQTQDSRTVLELDRAYVSPDWRGLRGQLERALDTDGCVDGNWIQIIAPAFGYSDRLLQRSYELLACDPRRSLSWFNASRAAFRAGDNDEAMRLAVEGTANAPGGWLATELVRSLAASGSYAEASQQLEDRIHEKEIALMFKTLIPAAKGDREAYDIAFENFKAGSPEQGDYWITIVAAWGGRREAANRAAAMIDQHSFGSATLVQLATWCACGAPFDLEATPNFAAQLEEGNLPWPPKEVMEFPLKDW